MYNRSTFSFTILVLAVFIFSLNAASLPEPFQPQFKPTINVPKVTGEVTVDGELDEVIWAQAAIAENFAEVNPGDQVAPPVESRALIAYDNKNLYVALIAFDDPSTVRTSYRDRDEIFRDDYFGLMLDTYDNQSWGYELFVNPYGVQGDLRMASSGGEDASFDIIWESIGKVTDSGYQVEIAIPFSSLRFPDKPEQRWRVNFWRDHQRDIRRRYAWAAQDRDDPCFICQWGYLTGIENIKPANNLEIMPSAVGYQSGELSNYNDPSSDFLNEDPDGEFSVNARYGLTSNSSVEATLNPDFSQVESDGAQIDVNTTFGLFFSETRPFFQEGGELFLTYFDAVYTRSINDPQAATKFTGQFGRTSVAYLFARDENSPIMMPLKQQTSFGQAENSISNVVRVRHGFWEESFIGFIATDRRMNDFGPSDIHKGGSSSLFGFDGSIRFAKQYRIEMQTLFSKTEEITDGHPFIGYDIDTTYNPIDSSIVSVDSTAEYDNLISARNQSTFDNGRYTVDLDGEDYWGEAMYLSLERSARHWNFDIDYWAVSPTFRGENGFINGTDYRNISVWTGYYSRPNKEWLIDWEPSINFGRKWTYHGTMNLGKYDNDAYDEWVRFELWGTLKGQTEISLNYLNSQERFFDVNFPGISIMTFYVNTRPSEIITGGARYNFGRGIRRNPSDPEMGFQKNFSLWGSVKPTERLYIVPEFEYQSMDHQDKYFTDPSHAGEPKEIFDARVFRSRMTYQFTRKLYLRLVVQYVDVAQYGFDDDKGEQTKEIYRNFSIEPLLTYKINPFTKFYIGMNSNYDRVNPGDQNSLLAPEYALMNRQFFMKLQYLFRI